MANEEVNWRVHDAGFGSWDWNYWTDKSVDDANAEIYSHANDESGITVDHVLAYVNSAADVDQITNREARMMVAVLNHLIPSMTLEAKRLVDAFTARMKERVSNIHDNSDERYADYENSWFGTDPRTGAGDAVFSGDDMRSLLSDLDRMAHPLRAIDDVDLSPIEIIGGLFTRG